MPLPWNLHIVRNDISHDSRVLKITGSIANSGYFDAVHVAGLHNGSGEEEITQGVRNIWHVPLRSRRLSRRLPSQVIQLAEWRLRIRRRYARTPIGVIHCHDLAPLPIAVGLAGRMGAKLVYDAHELETEVHHASWVRKTLARIVERRLIGQVNAMITVSPSIREWYHAAAPNIPIALVRNIPDPAATGAVPEDLRSSLGVPDEAVLFLYLGGFMPARGIEVMLEAFGHPGVSHHVLFLGSGVLQPAVEAAAARHGNIHFLPTIPSSEVVRYAAGADVGLIMTEDTCLNHRYALPNKLFECLVAGLPVLCSDMPDQASIVRSIDGGWIVEPHAESIVELLKRLDREEVSRIASGLPDRTRHMTWENESRVLLNLYRDLMAT